MQHLPKGSVTLGKSSSGNTHYIEPATARELNNKGITLAEQQRKEEDRTLARACGHIAAALHEIHVALDAVVLMDLAMARAGHSRCGAALNTNSGRAAAGLLNKTCACSAVRSRAQAGDDASQCRRGFVNRTQCIYWLQLGRLYIGSRVHELMHQCLTCASNVSQQVLAGGLVGSSLS